MPDEKKVAMALAFLEAGHADKLLLSADFTGQRTRTMEMVLLILLWGAALWVTRRPGRHA